MIDQPGKDITMRVAALMAGSLQKFPKIPNSTYSIPQSIKKILASKLIFRTVQNQETEQSKDGTKSNLLRKTLAT